MIEVNCKIEEKKTINEKQFFVVKELKDSFEYLIPEDQLLPFNIVVGNNYTFYKEFNKKYKKEFLRLKKAEKKYEIIGFNKSINQFGKEQNEFIVKVENGINVAVPCFSWQTKENWKEPELICEIKKYENNGLPLLLNKDFRHPIYKIGEEYDFQVIAQKKKILEKTEYSYFELRGEDGCLHEVNLIHGQALNLNKVEKVRCSVVDITYRVKLIQIKAKDPYFSSIEKIVTNSDVIGKYFKPIITTKFEGDSDIVHLIQQYQSESAFWVFTFTNKVLLKKLKEELIKYNYNSAKEINHLIITFENWIIKKGIISSIPDEKRKQETLFKAKAQLKNSLLIDNVLEGLTKNIYDPLIEFSNSKNANLGEFYYLLLFSNPEILDVKKVLNILKSFLSNFKLEDEFYFLNKLLSFISNRKRSLLNEKEEAYFNLTSVYSTSNSFDNNQIRYIYWCYAELIVAIALNKIELSNLLIGQILKRWVNAEPNIEKKYCLLINSYSFFKSPKKTNCELPFYFNDEELKIDYGKLLKIEEFENKHNDIWPYIENGYSTNSTIIVKLVKRAKDGFEVDYNGIAGFLPNYYITERSLKNYLFEDCKISVSVKIIALSSFFKFFIVGQISSDSSEYYVNNNITFKEGENLDGIIRKVEDFGCFIATAAGDGLLHLSNIFDENWDKERIYDFFPEGKRIRVLVMKNQTTSRIEFGLKQLKQLDPTFYFEFLDDIYSKNISNFDELEGKDLKFEGIYSLVQREKGLCFEQLAVLQKDIHDKLKSFALAKHFYLSINNARGYLANIYTSYFEILLKINDCLEKQSLKGLKQIKSDAENIKVGVNLKTIQTFPDSEKLFFFLDIISLFNNASDNSSELLYKYISTYANDSSKNALKTIAKITLANNLMISETKDGDEFSIKNLRLIFNYISNGVLSLSETIEDIHNREIKTEILYWREKIKGDENENLEFKSSLFTPILDEERQKKLTLLNNIPKKTDAIKKDIDRINGDLSKKAVIHSALKTLAAFANTSGGTLLLGVNDSKIIVGLEQEYLSFIKKSDQNRDGYGKYFDNLVKDYLGDSFSSLMIRKFLKFPEGDILIVTVKPSQQEVFLLKDEEGTALEQLYIRNLSSSKALWGIELTKFIKNRYLNQLNSNVFVSEN